MMTKITDGLPSNRKMPSDRVKSQVRRPTWVQTLEQQLSLGPLKGLRKW